MNEPNLDAEVRRGQEAKQLLEHPLLAGAFGDLKSGLVKAWEMSPVRDAEGREVIFTAMKLLDQLKGALEKHMMTGKLATQQLMDQLKGTNDVN